MIVYDTVLIWNVDEGEKRVHEGCPVRGLYAWGHATRCELVPWMNAGWRAMTPSRLCDRLIRRQLVALGTNFQGPVAYAIADQGMIGAACIATRSSSCY